MQMYLVSFTLLQQRIGIEAINTALISYQLQTEKLLKNILHLIASPATQEPIAVF
jgi:hypothetical protein